VQGNYYSAQFEGQRLCKFSPDGDLLNAYALPARCPTMPCFGGDDLQSLVVTSARNGMSDKQLAQYPGSGSVFLLRPGVAGVLPQSYG
jgi:sugar lactone lactonase YvrE